MQHAYGGYQPVEFTASSKATLKEVAECLRPHQDSIVDRWVAAQLKAYRPPRFSPEEVHERFGALFRRMLELLAEGSPETYIDELYERGAELAAREFPYEALIMSLHFLEESYMPSLISEDQQLTSKRFVWMDQFMHVVLGALATSYFRAFRDSLLGKAEAGRIVQEGLMPHIPLRAADLDVGFVYQSATEQALLGGDVLDLFMLSPTRVAFLIGDVSGHGVSAANDGAMLRNLFRGFLRRDESLVEAVECVNSVLCAELASGTFITAVFGTYDVGGTLCIVNAGHPRPIVCGGSACRESMAEGTLLGIVKDATYTAVELVLEPGELLFGYTDGLTEARCGAGFFGEERIAESLTAVREGLPQVIADHVRNEVLTFSGDHLTDDVAMLVLRRRRER